MTDLQNDNITRPNNPNIVKKIRIQADIVDKKQKKNQKYDKGANSK